MIAEAFKVIRHTIPTKPGVYRYYDEDGNILEEPKDYDLWKSYGDYTQHGKPLTVECKKYQQAKERALFEGFSLFGKDCIEMKGEDGKSVIDIFINRLNEMNSEELISYKITLSPTALKTIGL